MVETPVALRPMGEGREVVKGYGHIGLSLRRRRLSFLHEALRGRRCALAGLVLVRQKPGSAKGVIFITLEDDTGVANLVVWPSLFERPRRLILSAGMLGV